MDCNLCCGSSFFVLLQCLYLYNMFVAHTSFLYLCVCNMYSLPWVCTVSVSVHRLHHCIHSVRYLCTGCCHNSVCCVTKTLFLWTVIFYVYLVMYSLLNDKWQGMHVGDTCYITCYNHTKTTACYVYLWHCSIQLRIAWRWLSTQHNCCRCAYTLSVVCIISLE